MSCTPFFIVGASRSGTTMLRLLLNAHSMLGVPKELSYFERCSRAGILDQWDGVTMPEEAYRSFVQGFYNKKRVALEDVDLDRLEEEVMAATPRSLVAPFRMAMDAWAAANGKSCWGEKTPKNLFYVDLIHKMIPEARFIYIVRDPRAVVYSMNRFARFGQDSVLNAFNWLIAADKGHQLLLDSVPANQQMVLRYENLASDPQATAESICSFLDVPFEEDMMRFHESVSNEIHPASAELGGTQTLSKPVSTVSVDKWRTGLKERDIAEIERVCGEVMDRLGYGRTAARLPASAQLSLKAKLSYCQWQQRRNRDVRAFLIAFKPFERSLGKVRRLLSS